MTEAGDEQVLLQLYGTAACHLCEQAEALLHEVLENADSCVELVDISTSDALMSRYGLRIPVLTGADMQGVMHELNWPFDVQGLLQFLDLLEEEGPAAPGTDP